MEAKPVFCSTNGDPTRGIYFRCVLYIFCISCFSEQGVSVSTVSNVVSNRVCLCGILFSMAALYAAPVESSGHFGSLKRDAKTFFYSAVFSRLPGAQPGTESFTLSSFVPGAHNAERDSDGRCDADPGVGFRDPASGQHSGAEAGGRGQRQGVQKL